MMHIHPHATIVKYPQGLTVGELIKLLSSSDPSRLICFGKDDSPADVVYIYQDNKIVSIDSISTSPTGSSLEDAKNIYASMTGGGELSITEELRKLYPPPAGAGKQNDR